MSVLPAALEDLTKVTCRLEHDGMVLWAQLDNPPGNVLDGEMTASL